MALSPQRSTKLDIVIGEDGICAVCHSLFQWIDSIGQDFWTSKQDLEKKRKHYEDESQIHAAIDAGCAFCPLLAGSSERVESSSTSDTVLSIEGAITYNQPLLYHVTLYKHVETNALTMRLSIDENQRSTWVGKYVCSPMYIDIRQRVVSKTPGIIFPQVTNFMKQAREWIKECTECHEHCRREQSVGLPSRLLHVLPSNIKLVDTGPLFPHDLQYATLSHSWGQLKFFKLLKSNVLSMKSLVPESALTRTFQDAVRVNRELGLDYLWIDSLCILQDCKEDWERESASMADVCSNSLVNLRACDAIDGNGGCYYTDSEMTDRRRAFRYTYQGANTDSTICLDFMRCGLCGVAADGCHLASCAWALQERVLPLRNIHFSKSDMFWECKTRIASSVCPEGLFEGVPLYRLDTRLSLMELWPHLMGLYSQCKLTMLTDKVVALSGVARKVTEETGITYLAGLWCKDFESQLCWLTEDANLRPDTFQAPTWSWLSLNTKIFPASTYKWRDYETELCAQVIGCDIACVGDDPFGALNRGTLTLECMMLSSCSVTAYIHGNRLNTEQLREYIEKAFPTIYVGGRSFNTHIWWDALEDYPEQIYLVPIRKIYYLHGEHVLVGIDGLVLKSVSEEEGRQSYSRLGSFGGDFVSDSIREDAEANKACNEFSSSLITFYKTTWTEEVRNSLPRTEII